MAAKLTIRKLDSLRATGRHVEVFDALVAGLGLRVTPGGAKTWFVRYRVHDKQRRYRLGRYPALSLADARERARKLLVVVADGKDPAEDRRLGRSQEATFAALAAEVLAAKAKETRTKTIRERQRICDKELLPDWGARSAAAITRRDVVLLIERIGARAPVLAGRTLSLVNLIFNEGLRRGFPGIEANPAHLLRPPATENGRNRWLATAEIQTLWGACEEESAVTRGLVRFLILTAQRTGAACALRWIDLEDGVWRTPAAVFKGKRDHLTPLSAEALQVLEEVRPRTGKGEYVFPGRGGRRRRSLNTARKALRERAGLAASWTFHDFRRTFRTHATRATEDGGLEVAPHVADAVLGHVEVSLGYSRYTGERDRYLLAEKRDALTRWGAFVRAAVSAEEGEVAP